MRSLAVFLLALSLLTVGALVWTRVGPHGASHGDTVRRIDPDGREAAETGNAAPSRGQVAGPSAPSLRGTAFVDAPEAASVEPLVGFTPPPLFSTPERIAQVLHDGTRIERLWAEYAQDRATPETRRLIQVAQARLANSEEPSFWAAPRSSPSGTVGLHMRLLRAAPGLWRDIGFDTRLLSHGFIDDTEVEIIERVLTKHGDLLEVEDERRLSVSDGRYEDVFLRTIASWPRLPDGRSLPLGASVRVLPVVSEDRRYVTLRWRLRLAVPVGSPESGSPVATTVRVTPDGTFTLPDGGTVLLIARSVLCGPDGSESSSADAESEATRYMLMLHVALE